MRLDMHNCICCGDAISEDYDKVVIKVGHGTGRSSSRQEGMYLVESEEFEVVAKPTLYLCVACASAYRPALRSPVRQNIFFISITSSIVLIIGFLFGGIDAEIAIPALLIIGIAGVCMEPEKPRRRFVRRIVRKYLSDNHPGELPLEADVTSFCGRDQRYVANYHLQQMI